MYVVFFVYVSVSMFFFLLLPESQLTLKLLVDSFTFSLGKVG